MKQLAFLPILFFLGLSQSNAQIKKGSWLIGGSAAIGKMSIVGDIDDIQEFEGNYFSLSPEIGYFINNRWLVGSKMDIGLSNHITVMDNSSSFSGVRTWRDRRFSLSPFLRYYFNPQSQFKLFYELNTNVSINKSQLNYNYYNSNTINNSGTWYSLTLGNSVGADYFLAPNIAIEGTMAYNYYHFADNIKNILLNKQEYAFPKFVFNPQVSVKLFLNTDKTDSKVLADKYLKKGNITLGFGGSLILEKDRQLVSLAPSIGYFLTDKWMIGSSVGGYYYRDHSMGLYVEPELMFFQPIQKDLQFVLRGAASVRYSHYFDDIDGNNTGFSSGPLEAGMGLNKFIAENISIQGLVNLDSYLWKERIVARPNMAVRIQYFMDKRKIKN